MAGLSSPGQQRVEAEEAELELIVKSMEGSAAGADGPPAYNPPFLPSLASRQLNCSISFHSFHN